VKVGAATETEMKERKALYEDALHATRAALAEGIVSGGGTALLQCRKALDKLTAGEGDEATGRQGVAERAGNALPDDRRERRPGRLRGGQTTSSASKEKNYGFDADKNEYTDLRKRGIVDPVKVTRSALQNGASVACLLRPPNRSWPTFPRMGRRTITTTTTTAAGWWNGRWYGWYGWYGWHGWDGRHGGMM